MSLKSLLSKTIASLANTGWRGIAIAKLFASILKVVKPRYSIAEQNYRIAFPNASSSEREKWIAESYEHMALMAVECLVLQKDVNQVHSWVVETVGVEYLQEAAKAGKGAILNVCHAGNWELGGAWIASQNLAPFSVIVRHPQDKDEKTLIETFRRRLGIRTISKYDPMLRMVRCLKQGEFLAILTDQHGGPDGISVPFFGVETSTSQGAAVFARMTKAPLISAICIRLAPFKYRVVILPPIDWQELNNREQTIREITTRINQSVETMISLAPGQWLSQHRRFREHYGRMLNKQ